MRLLKIREQGNKNHPYWQKQRKKRERFYPKKKFKPKTVLRKAKCNNESK